MTPILVLLVLALNISTQIQSGWPSRLQISQRPKHVKIVRPSVHPTQARTSPLGSYPQAHKEVDLRVGEIGLGSYYADVRREFGVRGNIKKELSSDTTCGPPHRSLELKYRGLTIELQTLGNDKQFRVVAMEVDSSSWEIKPRVRVGINERSVREKLGRPASESDENGYHRLHYVNIGNDGFAVFYFKNSILVKVSWESNLC